MSNLWRSKFARFVRAYGVVRLARGLDISPSGIYHWIRGATAPRRVHAAVIQRLARESRVKLTLDEIYQHSRLRARERKSEAAGFSENAIHLAPHPPLSSSVSHGTAAPHAHSIKSAAAASARTASRAHPRNGVLLKEVER